MWMHIHLKHVTKCSHGFQQRFVPANPLDYAPKVSCKPVEDSTSSLSKDIPVHCVESLAASTITFCIWATDINTEEL